MVLYPEAQQRAQTEIDRAINNRLPTIDDHSTKRLPFVDALLLECYRWGPPGNLGEILSHFYQTARLTIIPCGGLPHRLDVDDIINGYTIPAGTTVISNIWYLYFAFTTTHSLSITFRSILHDKANYSHPMKFMPERFMTSEKILNPLEHVFGYGKRYVKSLIPTSALHSIFL